MVSIQFWPGDILLTSAPDSMPFHLQVELAKNQSPIAAQLGPQLGEDVYLFRLQINSLLKASRVALPNELHSEFMNRWHLDQVNTPRSSKADNPTPADLAVAPMCVEMMRSCGRALSLFNKPLFARSNIEHLVTDAGGLSLACMWLDLRTTIKVGNSDMYSTDLLTELNLTRSVISTLGDQNSTRQNCM
jgi:hypothetical protein